MTRILSVLVALFVATAASARSADAQEWRPPSRSMPAMPQASEVSAAWMSSNSGWFGSAARAAGVEAGSLRVAGEGRQSGGQVQVVRATSGPLPVVVWQDRNGDARADLIEIFRSGGVIIQLVDADYDGTANVLRVYDAAGKLVSEDRL
jgi:hypothetical protein